MAQATPVPQTNDAMADWLSRAGRTPRLTPVEEQALLEAAEKGSAAARQRLIEANLRLVYSIARKYTRPGVSLSDLVQEGTIGLVRGIDRFEPWRRVRVSTYCVWWIRHSIERFILDKCAVVRLPSQVAGQVHRLERAASKARARDGEDPDPEEWCELAGLEADAVMAAAALDRIPMSLDGPMAGDGDSTMAEGIADRAGWTEDEVIERVGMVQEVGAALAMLDPQESEALARRFGVLGHAPHTLKETADAMRISGERVRQLERVAQAKLRRIGLPSRDFESR